MITNKKKYVVAIVFLTLANTIFPNLYTVYAITTEALNTSETISNNSEDLENEEIENLDSTLLEPSSVQEDISLSSIEENNPDISYYNEEHFPNVENSLTTSNSKQDSIFTEDNLSNLLSVEEYERAKRVEEVINSLDFKTLMDFYQVDFSKIVPDSDESDESLGKTFDITDLERAFIKLQMDSEKFSNAYVMTYTEVLDKRLLEIIILSSYFIRWYDIHINDESLWTQLFFTPEKLMTNVTDKDKYLINLMDSILEKPKDMLSSNLVNQNISSKLLPGINSTFSSYKEIIEKFVFAQTGSNDYSKWFYSYFNGYIYKDELMLPIHDVGIWNRSKNFTNFLPYLLSLENDNNLVVGETRGEIIFTSTTVYGNDLEQTKKVVKNACRTITNILGLYDRTIEDTNLINVDAVVGQRGVLDSGRRWLNPKDSLSSIYKLADFKDSHGAAAAGAGAGQIVFQVYLMDDTATLAHELAHELNNLFDANGEFYSTYLSTAHRQLGAYVNTFADNTNIFNASSVIANKSTTRFQNKKDLTTYAHNLEEMVYLLDGLIAEKVLTLSPEEQLRYIRKALVNGENGSLLDISTDQTQIEYISVDELKKMNLTSVQDLIDNNLVIMEPSEVTENILKKAGEGYGTTLTYAAFFLVNGKSYHHNHRIINTLLAKDGWEAFKTFNMSYNTEYNKLLNEGLEVGEELVGKASLVALRKVYGDETITYKNVLSENYQTVLQEAKEKGLLLDEYDELFSGLNSVNLENFYKFKKNMIVKYMNLTNEFDLSAIGENEHVGYTQVTNYDELYDTIQNNPNAFIKLNNNIKVEGEHKSESLPPFSGELNGNGFIIANGTQSLFESLNEATITKLILENFQVSYSDLAENYYGILSNKADNSQINDTHIMNSTVFNELTSTRPAVGGLIGYVSNSVIRGSTVQETKIIGDYVGGLVGIMTNTILHESYSSGEISALNSSNIRIGGLVGNGFGNSKILNCYSNMIVSDGNGILGSDYDYGNKNITIKNTLSFSDIPNSKKYKFAEGDLILQGTNNYEVYEFTGISSKDFLTLDVTTLALSDINQSLFEQKLNWTTTEWDFTNSTIYPALNNLDPRNGKNKTDKSSLKLKELFTSIAPGEKIDWRDYISEALDSEGETVNHSSIEVTSMVDLYIPGLYTVTYNLGKSSATLYVQVRDEPVSITTYTELFEAIQRNPKGHYILSNNIKVEGEYKSESLPPFSGELNGNGFIIANGTQSLFESLNEATITKLILENFQVSYSDLAENYYGILSNKADNSQINDTHIMNSTVFNESTSTRPAVGGLIGYVSNSVIRGSTVQETKIIGDYVGGLVGIMTNTILHESYSSGEISALNSSNIRIGGLVGNGFGNSKILNCYSNMIVSDGNGILGSDYDYGNKNITIKNTLSFSDIPNSKKYKFAEGDLILQGTNNYEVFEFTGISSKDFLTLDVTTLALSDINQSLFEQKLNWTTTEWDFTNSIIYPALNNLDPRNGKNKTDKSSLKLKELFTSIAPGEKIDWRDYISEALDSEGETVNHSSIEVTSTVDLYIPGLYTVTYNFGKSSATLYVQVRDEALLITTYTELFEAIQRNPSAVLQLENNIDIGYTNSLGSLPDFSGRLKGNGYTLSNSSHLLFNSLSQASISNLVISNFNVTYIGEQYYGILANAAVNTHIEDVHVVHSSLASSVNIGKPTTGGLIGRADKTTIIESSVQSSIISGIFAGGLVGSMTGTKIENSYTTGQVTPLYQVSDTRLGGLVGNGFGDSEISNSYSAEDVTNGNGILGSNYNGSNSRIVIKNTLSLSDALTSSNYKFYQSDVSTIWNNNYEIAEKNGLSSTSFDSLHVQEISENNLNKSFYSDKLNWSNELWLTENFELLPVLNNSDPRNNQKIDLSTLKVAKDNIELFVDDNWSAADNFISATTSDGNSLGFEDIIVNGIVDTTVAQMYTLTYINGSLSVDVTVQVKEIPTGTIIDPTNPEVILPQGIGNPELELLRINYASSFNFGNTKLAKSTQVYYARLDTIITESSVEKKVPNFISVEDNRQVNGGWKVTVAQNGQLSTTNGDKLLGAEISFKGLTQLRNVAYAPNLATEQVLAIDGSAVPVADALIGNGSGSWSIAFGNENTAKTAVKLTIPGESKKIKDVQYRTMLTWDLGNTPL